MKTNKKPQSMSKSDPVAPEPVKVEVHLCIPEDQERFVPKRRRAPSTLPSDAPIPRLGELVYLSSTSAWGVVYVIHEWLAPEHLKVQVWLEYMAGGARYSRPTGFGMTQ